MDLNFFLYTIGQRKGLGLALPAPMYVYKKDMEQNKANHAREEEAFRVGKEKIAEHGLDMKLVSVQYTFDNSKLLFYFTSDGRVDFRELNKCLSSRIKYHLFKLIRCYLPRNILFLGHLF